MDTVLLAEADLGFGRMNIDIDFFGRHFEKEQDDGERSRRQDVTVSFADGVEQQPITDKPLIYKDVDGITIEFLELRLGIEAAHAQRAGLAHRF